MWVKFYLEVFLTHPVLMYTRIQIDPNPRFLKWILIRGSKWIRLWLNEVDPGGSGSETLLVSTVKRYKISRNYHLL